MVAATFSFKPNFRHPLLFFVDGHLRASSKLGIWSGCTAGSSRAGGLYCSGSACTGQGEVKPSISDEAAPAVGHNALEILGTDNPNVTIAEHSRPNLSRSERRDQVNFRSAGTPLFWQSRSNAACAARTASALGSIRDLR